jgi:integrase
VPIHPDLAGIVSRCCAGKASDAYLFPEAGPKRAGRERSMAVSQRFTRYRQTVDVHDKAEGVRHSRVDFHSWRRWFITMARNARIDRATVAAVVGHAAGYLTDDVYSGGPSDELLIARVAAVRLPVA